MDGIHEMPGARIDPEVWQVIAVATARMPAMHRATAPAPKINREWPRPVCSIRFLSYFVDLSVMRPPSSYSRHMRSAGSHAALLLPVSSPEVQGNASLSHEEVSRP